MAVQASQVWQVWLLAAALGVGGGAGSRLVVPDRQDPWTGADDARVRAEFERRISSMQREMKLELRELEHRLRTSRPPVPTRLRIRACETAIRELKYEQGEEWEPPTMQFSESDGVR